LIATLTAPLAFELHFSRTARERNLFSFLDAHYVRVQTLAITAVPSVAVPP
jgi:hypothetical protein